MPMIDIGIKIEVANTEGSSVPVSVWKQLNDCVAMPALIQPSSKIATDFIGDKYIGELLGKVAITALDFTFAFDTGDKDGQFRFLMDAASDADQRWIRITYPDETLFEFLAEFEVSLVAPTPSAELDYILSVVPVKQDIGDLIIITFPNATSPLDAKA